MGIGDLAEEMCGCDIDAIKISSPFAGMGFISPEHYEEFVLPYERAIISRIRAKGKHVYILPADILTTGLNLCSNPGQAVLNVWTPNL